jgi:hypothetical protein
MTTPPHDPGSQGLDPQDADPQDADLVEPLAAHDPTPTGGSGEARSGGTLRSPRLTALLAILVVVLLAIIIAPSLNLPRIVIVLDPTVSPTGSATAPSATPTATPSAIPTPAVSPTFRRPTPTPAPTFLSYVVQPGDSLGSIGSTYGTTARSIAWWNRGTYPSLDPESPDYQPNRIVVGWVLVLIPGVIVDDSNPPTPSPGPPTPTPAPTKEISPAPTAAP